MHACHGNVAPTPLAHLAPHRTPVCPAAAPRSRPPSPPRLAQPPSVNALAARRAFRARPAPASLRPSLPWAPFFLLRVASLGAARAASSASPSGFSSAKSCSVPTSCATLKRGCHRPSLSRARSGSDTASPERSTSAYAVCVALTRTAPPSRARAERRQRERLWRGRALCRRERHGDNGQHHCGGRHRGAPPAPPHCPRRPPRRPRPPPLPPAPPLPRPAPPRAPPHSNTGSNSGTRPSATGSGTGICELSRGARQRPHAALFAPAQLAPAPRPRGQGRGERGAGAGRRGPAELPVRRGGGGVLGGRV
jgi:hypothetical protein